MTRAPGEPKSWAPKDEAECVAAALRDQIQAAKARFADFHEQMEAIGLTTERDQEETSASQPPPGVG